MMRRATVSESPTIEHKTPAFIAKTAEAEKPATKRRATWLHRDPSTASASSETWEVVKPAETTTTSSTSFWKLNLASSSASTPAAAPTSNVPASSATVPTPAAPSGEGVFSSPSS